MTTEITHEQRMESAAREAAGILQEDAPRTAAEQAAIDVLDQRRWVLWHAKDYSLGVIRLLSLRGLLRDTSQEKKQAQAERFWSEHSERTRAADRAAVGRLAELADAAAERLERGDAPGEVAEWLRSAREAICEAREATASGSEGTR